ncbi:cytochrome b/b6 domain-containing protein [Aestuariivirga sp.]|uniref:cytochrome b/b6 domain-containing protein n=1 Tax=Aestuariivirga sp. TaxID=2650926 RepID=UPI0035941C08
MGRTGLKTHGRVWDPLVRLFHWSLAAAFAAAWLYQSESTIHETAGKLLLGLLIFRLAWGIIGPASARFETFVTGPITALKYVCDILRGRPKHFLGHNPAGAAMIAALMASLATTTVSGLLMTTTALWGGEWVEWIHGTAAYTSLWLIGGHLLGVVLASFQHRENLPLAMVTGRKGSEADFWPHLGPPAFYLFRILAAACLVAALAFAWWGSMKVLNGSLWRMPKIIAAAAKEQQCGSVAVAGPRLEVYPDIMLRYAVTADRSLQAVETEVPFRIALKPRPASTELKLPRYCGSVTGTGSTDDPPPLAEAGTEIVPPQKLAIGEASVDPGQMAQSSADPSIAGTGTSTVTTAAEPAMDSANSQTSTPSASVPGKDRQKRKRKRKGGGD